MKAEDKWLDKKILSYTIGNKKFAVELSSAVNKEYFDDSLQWLFDVVYKHFNNPQYKEIPTENIIRDYLNKDGLDEERINEKINLYTEIKSLTDNAPEEFTWYLGKLKNRYNIFITQEMLYKIGKANGATEEEKVSKVNKIIRESTVSIDKIYQQKAYNEGLLKDSAKERWEKYKEIESNPSIAKGLMTGFSQFDRSTNGLHRGELVIIVGNTGGGKSIIMHNIAVNAYLGSNKPLDVSCDDMVDGGANILYFSLEMPKESIERRIDACMGELYYAQVRDGLLNDEDKLKYKKILQFQAKYNKQFYVVDMPKGCSVRDIEVKFLEIKENMFTPDIIVIDYLGIMSSNSGEDDWLALGQISAELHEFARLSECVVLTGAQANRAPKEGKVKYSTDRIGRSDMISHNANVIMQIHRRENEDLCSDIEIELTKVRDGARGMFVLAKDFAKMKVRDLFDENYASGDDASI